MKELVGIFNKNGFAIIQCFALSFAAYMLLHSEKGNKNTKFLLCLSAIFSFVLIKTHFSSYNFVKLLAIVVATIIIWRLIFCDSMGKIVFFSIIVYYEMMFADLITGNITALLFQNNILQLIYSDAYIRFAFSTVSAIIYLLLLFGSYRFFKIKKLEIHNKYWLAVDTILAFCFAISLLFMDFNATINSRTLSFAALLIWIGFALIAVLIVKLFTSLCFFFQDEKIKTVLRVKNEALENLVNVHTQSLETMQVYRHDLKNRMATIIYRAGDYLDEDLKSMLNEFTEQLSAEKVVYCKNATITAIINIKKQACMDYNINLTVKVDKEYDTRVNSLDLVSLLSNLIDNAIEAVLQLPEVEREIDLQIGVYKAYDCISIRNNYLKVEINSNGEFVSTKEDKALHGYGLKSVKEITEKYKGNLQLYTNDNIFIATVLLKL